MDIDVHIRWMIRRDMKEVLDIERAVFEFQWKDDDFRRCLRQRNCIGMVAEYDEQVVGYMIYELHKDHLHVLNFAVTPDLSRRSIGMQMVTKLIKKLSAERRNRIETEVRETNLPALQFFRAMGFKAIQTLRDYYDDTTEDAYGMVRRYQSPTAAPSDPLKPVNRIARLTE